MKDFIEQLVIWVLFALAVLCIFLLVFFIGDAVFNGFVTVESCEVTK